MSGILKARIAFVIAIGLLLACALIVYGTDRGFLANVELVQHTQNVEVLLGQTESVIASAARARLTYVFSGDVQALAQYQQSLSGIHIQLAELRRSTSDNPLQQANCNQLETLVNERIQVWEKSVALKKSGAPVAPGQPDLTRQSVAFADEIIAVTQRMRAAESRLLQQRQIAVKMSYFVARAIRITTFITAVLLLFWHYRRANTPRSNRLQPQASPATPNAGRANPKRLLWQATKERAI